MSKPYCQYGILWIPLSQLAQEYQKDRSTLWRWVVDGFLIQMGYAIMRDPSGYWYAGKRL